MAATREEYYADLERQVFHEIEGKDLELLREILNSSAVKQMLSNILHLQRAKLMKMGLKKYDDLREVGFAQGESQGLRLAVATIIDYFDEKEQDDG